MNIKYDGILKQLGSTFAYNSQQVNEPSEVFKLKPEQVLKILFLST